MGVLCLLLMMNLFTRSMNPSLILSLEILKEGRMVSTIPSSLFPIGLVPLYPIFYIMRKPFSYCSVGIWISCVFDLVSTSSLYNPFRMSLSSSSSHNVFASLIKVPL